MVSAARLRWITEQIRMGRTCKISMNVHAGYTIVHVHLAGWDPAAACDLAIGWVQGLLHALQNYVVIDRGHAASDGTSHMVFKYSPVPRNQAPRQARSVPPPPSKRPLVQPPASAATEAPAHQAPDPWMAGADPWQTPKHAADPAPKKAKTENSAVTIEDNTTVMDMALDAPSGNALATGLVQPPEPPGLEAVAATEVPRAAAPATAAAVASAPVADLPMNLDEPPDAAASPVEDEEQVGLPMNLGGCPEGVLQIMIDEAKEEIKQFVELTTIAKDEGNLAGVQLYKTQMRKQVEFLRERTTRTCCPSCSGALRILTCRTKRGPGALLRGAALPPACLAGPSAALELL